MAKKSDGVRNRYLQDVRSRLRRFAKAFRDYLKHAMRKQGTMDDSPPAGGVLARYLATVAASAMFPNAPSTLILAIAPTMACPSAPYLNAHVEVARMTKRTRAAENGPVAAKTFKQGLDTLLLLLPGSMTWAGRSHRGRARGVRRARAQGRKEDCCFSALAGSRDDRD